MGDSYRPGLLFLRFRKLATDLLVVLNALGNIEERVIPSDQIILDRKYGLDALATDLSTPLPQPKNAMKSDRPNALLTIPHENSAR